MSKFNRFGIRFFVVLLVVGIALGGLSGCSSDSGSTGSTGSTGSSGGSGDAGLSGECTGGSLDACNTSCDGLSTVSDIADCKEVCLRNCI